MDNDASQHDIFINTANEDNTPVSVIEAMALGLPVVSTSVGGVPYLIKNGESGLLVNLGDRENFVKAIVSLIEEGISGVKLAEHGRQIAEQYSWAEVRHEWVTHLDAC